MFRTLIFVVCIARAQVWDSADSSNKPNGWIENLKRRLMVDNYDYQPSSGDLELRAMDKNPSKAPMELETTEATTTADYDLLDAQEKVDAPIQFVYDSVEKNYEKTDVYNDISTVHSLYAPRHRLNDVYFAPQVPQNSIDERDDYHGISRNDLQIYLKDTKKQDPVAAKNVSYKVIQPSLLSRRAGSAAPRFVEEVGATGVSLISVDGAPFPEFQLPSARRQYQAVKGSASEDWLD